MKGDISVASSFGHSKNIKRQRNALRIGPKDTTLYITERLGSNNVVYIFQRDTLAKSNKQTFQDMAIYHNHQ